MEIMGENVIVIRDLKKTFRLGFAARKRVQALDGVSLNVARNKIFGFLGPNGAGKTTTIKILAGLIFPTSGYVQILGATSVAVTKGRCGYLPENPSFSDFLTGREILTLLGKLLGINGIKLKKCVNELLELTKLQFAADIPSRRYSKGMVQRLGIAQALLADPDLVILDEPMSGLDPIGRRDVKDIMRTLHSQGKTVFFSTHIIADVEEICDEVAILVGGKVVRSGNVRDLMDGAHGEIEIVARNVPNGLKLDELNEKINQFVVKDHEEMRKLIEKLLAADAHIVSVKPRFSNLESLFFSEVGKRPVGARVVGEG